MFYGRGMLGAGILGMPKAFSQSGLWLGIIACVILTTIVILCMLLLIKVSHNFLNPIIL